MKKEIRVVVGKLEVSGWLNESGTAAKVWDVLPITAQANVWADEIYFDIPMEAELEDAKEVVGLGDVGYWPPGKAMCIFFGRTPVSRGDEIRPVSPVSIIGHLDGDLKALKKVRAGERIVVEKR